jgi:acetyl-CoA carboxylase biotin carboxyl carrier protein
MALSDEDVREILRIIDESDLAELRLETEGFSLHVVRGGRGDAGSSTPLQRPGVAEPASARPSAQTAAASAAAEAPGGSSADLGELEADGLATIEAPMLGTFYRAEAPGKPPFVEVGSAVEPDTIVCIIEVMKMMNSVPAGVSGTIAEVIPANAELVEYGQPLFRVQVKPA